MRALAQALTSGRVETLEYELNGHRMEARLIAVADRPQVLCIARDITARAVSEEQMRLYVVHNTFVQGSLSIVFVVLALIVMGTAVQTAWRAYRKTQPGHSNEDPRVESRLFAPAGLLPTPSEKVLLARWETASSPATPAVMGH
jgi:hypothetical protein